MAFNLDISLNKTQLSTHNPHLNSCVFIDGREIYGDIGHG
jgi:hypothetical protein